MLRDFIELGHTINMENSTIPSFKHLNGHSSHLVVLRSSVTPILSNRILTHFTDHSVNHSDNVSNLVDDLIEPLQTSKHALTKQELTILYAACYLHDIGMHYEKASETNIIRSLHLTRPWLELPENERRDLLRKYHHNISAEMIMASVGAENPIIGLQMTDQYVPEHVAAISEAHNMPIETERYRELTTDVANVRMGLLSGILRIADILDESRRRATLEQARTLKLDLTSQSHWWRHYYTSDIKIDLNQRLITIWFDFPKERFSEYNSIVPQLQMPWIEAEFNRHLPIFHQFDFGWSVTHVSPNKPYTSAKVMPDSVLSEMWKQITIQRKREDEERQNETLQHFRQSMPYIDRRLIALEARKETITPREFLIETSQIANDLWDMGSKRGASQLLSEAFKDDVIRALCPVERLKVGIQLATMFNEDDSRRALGILQRLQQTAEELSDNEEMKFVFWKTYAQNLMNLCGYDDAVHAFTRAMNLAPHDTALQELKAQLTESQLLFGELETIVSNLEEVNH